MGIDENFLNCKVVKYIYVCIYDNGLYILFLGFILGLRLICIIKILLI